MRTIFAFLFAITAVLVLSEASYPRHILLNTTEDYETHWKRLTILNRTISKSSDGQEVVLSVLVNSDEGMNQVRRLEQERVVSVVDPRHRELSLGDIFGFDFERKFPCYRTLAQLHSRIDEIVANHPDIATTESIGTSYLEQASGNGYDIPVLVLTNFGSTFPKVPALLVSGIHPRELTPVESILRLAEYLVDNKNDPEISYLLDHTEIHIVPMVNPDTRAEIEVTGKRLRKNRHNYGCKISHPGVDLNRNFPIHYGMDSGSSSDPCHNNYRGSNALSEPETENLFVYARQLFGATERPLSQLYNKCPEETPGLFLDVHSQGRLIIFPWSAFGDRKAPNDEVTMASKMATLAGGFQLWGPGQEGFLYPASGSSTDGIYGQFCVPSFGFELGNDHFEKCKDYEEYVWPGVLASLLYSLTTATKAFHTSRGPDILSYSIEGGVLRVQVSDDALTVAESQPIQQVLVFGQDPDTPGAIPQAMTPVDGVFDSSTEEATLDVSGMPGATLHIVAEDQAGYRGPVFVTTNSEISMEDRYPPVRQSPPSLFGFLPWK